MKVNIMLLSCVELGWDEMLQVAYRPGTRPDHFRRFRTIQLLQEPALGMVTGEGSLRYECLGRRRTELLSF